MDTLCENSWLIHQLPILPEVFFSERHTEPSEDFSLSTQNHMGEYVRGNNIFIYFSTEGMTWILVLFVYHQ